MSEELIGAFDIRGAENSGLTVDVAWNLGKALAEWLPEAGAVVVNYIPTHQHVAEAVIEGLRLQGRGVIDGGYGDADAIKTHIATGGLAGGARVGFDDLDKVITIELYTADGRLVTGETGLHDIAALVEAGNFVPAATKGELLQTA